MADLRELGNAFSLFDFNNTSNVTEEVMNVSMTTMQPELDETYMRVKNVMFRMQYFLLPLFLVTGLFGNLFTMATMASSRFKHLTSRYILIFLAISDTVLLLAQPFNKLWVINLFGTDLRALSQISCKAFFVIFRSAKMTSSWLVVLLCFERFVAVVFPLKAKSIIRKRLIFPAIALNYIIMLTYNSAWHFSSGVIDGVCKPDLPSLRHKVFVTIGTTFYSLVPTALLMIFTPQIIIRLIHQQSIRRQLSTRGSRGEKTNRSAFRKNEREMFRASVMVLGVMIAYIILIIPITTVHLYAFTAGVSAFDHGSLGFFIYREIAQTLEQINYAVNFFFYVMCSFAFRQRVKEILCCTSCRSLNDGNNLINKGSFNTSLKSKPSTPGQEDTE